ncbi:hypothetical protein D9758_014127 [Tetrapyrgos nigripes]|uniref:Chitin-binding type-4 domain-containing protein n=1 Tax=Tetrapyrgos nigripes TaxID=182062 RepID=A0A8H5CN13_9AGAR|nr:hypothetical protein D9758_014127 [Tetrapyrgos nigripes]
MHAVVFVFFQSRIYEVSAMKYRYVDEGLTSGPAVNQADNGWAYKPSPGRFHSSRREMYQFLALLACLIVQVAAHGAVSTPTPRALGSAALGACGTGAYNVLNSDKYAPIENAAKKVDANYDEAACHLFFCRGAQLEDNLSNTRVYKPGTVVPFSVDIEAHHTGYANVSVVDLAAQLPIARLFTWPVYANDSLGPSQWPKNETSFNVTVPDLGGRCASAGACAIQWWWYGTQVKQTYESCVDFTQ